MFIDNTPPLKRTALRLILSMNLVLMRYWKNTQHMC